MSKIAPSAAALLLLLAACKDPGREKQPEASEPPDGAAREQQAWRSDRVLVQLADPDDAAAVAADLGLTLLRGPTADGRVSFGIPAGATVEGTLARLAREPRVSLARPMGMIHGAAGPGVASSARPAGAGWCDRAGEVAELQWHLDAAGQGSGLTSAALREVVVAVLDTGVAYEDYEGPDGARYALAPSLAGAEFVAPADFVEGDGRPHDDHGHGTHIASLIASDGEVCGVAPGVRIMPIKVLGADNTGDELALIEGIYHAVANGADVINMSLSFGPGYVPSPELRDALALAYDEELVMVASAGNTGGTQVTWPAASSHVIAVAASAPAAGGGQAVAGYSNRGGGVDLIAPGGDLLADADEDGRPDGLLAESIDPADPSQVGYWYMAGTSQAAALVSGAAARLVAAGADDYGALSALLAAASAEGLGEYPPAEGLGAGALDSEAADELWDETHLEIYKKYVSILPWLAPAGEGEVRPVVRIVAVDRSGNPVDNAIVHGTLRGTTEERFSCALVAGECTAAGSPVADGAVGWSVLIDALEIEGVLVPPATALSVTEELEILAAALQSDAALAGSALALRWEDGIEEDLGEVAAGWSVVDLAAGWCVQPHAVVASPALLDSLGVSAEALLDLDLSGASEQERGDLAVRRWTLTGSGLSSSPLGTTSLSLALIGAADLRASGLDLRLSSLASLDAAGAFVATTDGGALGGAFEPVWVPQVMAAGGWTSERGYGAAELLIGAGALGLPKAPVAGSGAAGAIRLEQ